MKNILYDPTFVPSYRFLGNDRLIPFLGGAIIGGIGGAALSNNKMNSQMGYQMMPYPPMNQIPYNAYYYYPYQMYTYPNMNMYSFNYEYPEYR